MKNILSTIRFIDDGGGVFIGTIAIFVTWRKVLMENLKQFGLTIKDEDWSIAVSSGETVHILDILFGFNENGNLKTDLYLKETDSRGYLRYRSCHLNHIFVGILYSQGLRLRRIISNDEVLHVRLEELKVDFIPSKYLVKLIENISKKGRELPRTPKTLPNQSYVNYVSVLRLDFIESYQKHISNKVI